MRYTQVAVFGGTGFIGRYVVDALADLPNTVIRVPTRSIPGAYFLRTAGTVGQVAPIVCDLHDDAYVAQAVSGCDWVVNLIGILNESGKSTFEAVHHQFAARLAKAAAHAGVEKLVHVSALGADENGPSRYLQSKALGEKAVRTYFPSATILRPSLVFGAEDNFFNLFARMASVAPFMPLIGGGKTQFQPVYVGDVAQAVIKVLQNENAQGKTYELGGSDRYTFKELLEKTMEITGHKRRFITIPFGLAKVQGGIMQHLPGKLLTKDQVASLTVDNVLSGKNPELHDLGIAPMALDSVLPTYLNRFKAGGRFAPKKVA